MMLYQWHHSWCLFFCHSCTNSAVFWLFSFPSLGDLSAQDSSEKDQERKKQQLQDPALMPLPDAGADGPLDWAHLVDAAKAFEGRYTFCFRLLLSLCHQKRPPQIQNFRLEVGRTLSLQFNMDNMDNWVNLCCVLYHLLPTLSVPFVSLKSCIV